MSWGVAHRLRGMDSVMRCLTSWSSSRPYAVSTHPGPSTFTRTWGAADCASARLKLYTPPFTAQNTWLYSPRIAPVRTWSHDMLRMTPPAGCSRISATQVHGKEAVELLGPAEPRPLAGQDVGPGVVDPDVDAPECSPRPCDQGIEVVLPRHIGA